MLMNSSFLSELGSTLTVLLRYLFLIGFFKEFVARNESESSQKISWSILWTIPELKNIMNTFANINEKGSFLPSN